MSGVVDIIVAAGLAVVVIGSAVFTFAVSVAAFRMIKEAL